MNWLAHLYLSEPSPAFRLGNLLPDLVSATALTGLPPEFQAGIQRHRRIDAFTDRHPVFRRSVHRLGAPFRRFGGVLVDIFYDHILARDWESFAPMPLPAFAAEVYASFDTQWIHVPAEARPRLEAMCRADWLCGYREVATITEALTRIGARLRRPTDLAASIPILEREYEALRTDFAEFFPELITHVIPAATTEGGGADAQPGGGGPAKQ
ncbi:MAG: ACP phosphodiesterase [Chthoniobacter sp.]|uniref:acyl carrier protein phosphodiesterase n=1 Tax=Chthoniobacter sp. TaxID=2510640 RepID=UPI0032A9D8BD